MPGNLDSNAREHGLRNGNRKSIGVIGFGILQVVKRIVFFLGSDCNTASILGVQEGTRILEPIMEWGADLEANN